MTDTATMRAVVQDRYGAPGDVLRVADVPRPVPSRGQVLVRVRAASVNTPDWLAVSGVPYFIRAVFGLFGPKQRVRGTDVAGVVEAVGDGVDDLRPGDEVLGSTWDGARGSCGTFAELAVAPADQLVRKPDGVSFEDAAACVMSGVTALTAMRDVARVRAGQRVLVNGASGGVGMLAVQVAKHLGAEVTGVCSTRNVELVRSLGADHVVDYTRDDFTRGDVRYDVVLDDVMNRRPREVLRVVTRDGLYLPNSVGQGRFVGGLPRMAWAKLVGGRRVKTVTIATKRDVLASVASMLARGELRVVTDQVFPLDRAADAVALMMSHRARGKLVVTV